MKIDGILMSAMKSGSTWLSYQCSKHPDINVIPGQDVKIDNSIGLRIETAKTYPRKRINLVRRNIKLEKIYLESYYLNNPDMKFISLLREPNARTFSHYQHYIRKSYSSGIKIKPHSSNGAELVFDYNIAINNCLKSNESPEFIERSKYYSNLKPYIEKFGKEKFLVMTLESSTRNPQYLLEQVSQFLQIDNFPENLNYDPVNVRSFSEKRLFQKKIVFVPPTYETKQKLAHLLEDELLKLDEMLNVDFKQQWSL